MEKERVAKGRRFGRLLSAIAFGAIMFAAGAVASWKGAPYARQLWRAFSGGDGRVEAPHAPGPGYAEQVAQSLTRPREEALALRRWLSDEVVPPSAPVAMATPAELEAFLSRFDTRNVARSAGRRSDLFTTMVYGSPYSGLLLRGQDAAEGRGLLIYHQGHRGNPLDFEITGDVVATSERLGFDVMLLSMTGLGFNADDEIVLPTRMGLVQAPAPLRHDSFAFFADPEHPQRTGAGVMLAGARAVIGAVIDRGGYQRVAMAGISGGGWAATFLAAIAPEIDASISFAGTVPLAFRTIRRNFGDYEQVHDPVFRRIGYWDLYLLATLDGAGEGGRRHLQVYNRNDPCCFDGATAEMIQAIDVQSGGAEGLEFLIVESDAHAPHVPTLAALLESL